MRGLTGGLLLAIFAISGWSQQFEVVAVKPNKSGSGNSRINTDEVRLTATNVTLVSLITMAYGIKEYQLDAPAWMRQERYDIAAKFPEALPSRGAAYNESLYAMLKQMMAERFKLEIHRETRVLPVYALVVAKGGAKIKQAVDTGDHNQDTTNNHYTARAASMSMLASWLSRREEYPVLDMTELAGFYNFTMEWVPEATGPAGKSDDVAAGPTLELALTEQAGLKLEARKVPIEVLVVDRAERVPTEN